MKSIKTLPLCLVAIFAASIARAQQLSPKELAAVAGADGEARLVLPYSSGRADLGQTSPWRIESEGRSKEIPVEEAAVLGGRDLRIEMPGA